VSYFDDPERAKALEAEARSWLGTPFRECYRRDLAAFDLKGKGGGIDCVGLVQEVMRRVGAAGEFTFARQPSDYQSHQLGDKVLDWLRGKIDNPESRRLGAMFEELAIPDQVRDPDAPTPRDFFKPGDILVLRHGSLFHLPVVVDRELHFVSALPRVGVTEGTIQDSTYSGHLVAAFRMRG